jgi:hypothetical protein
MTTYRPLRTLVATLVLTVLAVGCGDQEPLKRTGPVRYGTTTEPAGNNPCRLLTNDDLQRVFDQPFAEGTFPTGSLDQCEFRVGANPAPDAPMVSLHVDPELTIARFETMKLQTPDAREVTGVGDQAFFGGGRLWVREGVFGFDVGTTLPILGDPAGIDKLIEVGQIVAERHK